jgi:hypothetical protein
MLAGRDLYSEEGFEVPAFKRGALFWRISCLFVVRKANFLDLAHQSS